MARFMSGATQVILAIFLPVWVDAFAPVDKKTRWMTLIITAAPMGLLAGYGMSAIVISTSDEWWWAFYLIIIAMVPLIVILSCIKSSKIDIKEHLKIQQEQDAVGSIGEVSHDGINDAMSSYISSTSSPCIVRENRYQKLMSRLIELEI